MPNLGTQIQRRYKKKSWEKNKKLPSVTLFSRLNIEFEHINTINRTKNYYSTLIFLCFRQYLQKKVRASCAELSTKQLDQLEFCPSTPTMVTHWVDPWLGIILLKPKLKLWISPSRCLLPDKNGLTPNMCDFEALTLTSGCGTLLYWDHKI